MPEIRLTQSSPSPSRKRWPAGLAAPLLALGLACAGQVAIADDMPTYQLVIKDGRLFPETIEVPAQTRFRLEVRNEGSDAAEFESLELKKEVVLAPGITRKLVFVPLKAGTYRFFDEFHAETAQGRIVAK